MEICYEVLYETGRKEGKGSVKHNAAPFSYKESAMYLAKRPKCACPRGVEETKWF